MSALSVLGRRRSGVLLHPTSLPGPGRCGGLGQAAHDFADMLQQSGFGVWQTLPLNPRDDSGSPYSSSSVFALDTDLVDVGLLAHEGLLPAEASLTDTQARDHLVAQIHDPQREELRGEFERFAHAQSYWLEDFCLYTLLRRQMHRPWYEWPAPLRDRDPRALADVRRRHGAELEGERVMQFLCDRQWHALRRHANAQDVLMFGDLAFFVAHDSADVWAGRALFQVDAAGRLAANTGVPPDYFSASGQLWGMPHYDWRRMAAGGWGWWIERIRRQLELFDLVRVDHFRGLEAAWRVAPDAEDARDGQWEPGPGLALLDAVRAALGDLPLIAEDLGYITDAVREQRDRAGLPGMRVLQFAFDGSPGNPYLPHNYTPDTVAYTGTHDNNTLRGWWTDECDAHIRERVHAYLGGWCPRPCEGLEMLALSSVARLAVLPMQDVLGLGTRARMNRPGIQAGNWQWRVPRLPAPDTEMRRLRAWNVLYGRVG